MTKPLLTTSPMIDGKPVTLVQTVPFYRVYTPTVDPLDDEGGRTLHFVNTASNCVEFTMEINAGMGQGMGYIDDICWKNGEVQ